MRRTFSTLGAAVLAASLVAPGTAHAAAEPRDSKIVDFKISTTKDAWLTVSGRLAAADGSPVGAGRDLIIETMPASRSKWYRMPLSKKAKPIKLKTREGGAFSGRYYAGYAHGWYRIRFAGGPLLKPAVSAVVRDTRINALTTKWKVTPRKVRKGGYVTFSGVLTHDPVVKYVPFAGQRVYIYGRIKGQKKWYWYARPKTNSKGYFKARFRVSKDTYFEWYYAGNATHYYDFPLKSTFVDVR
ncbi:hypothetical protein [Actinomadura rudentiformis]|uniref:Uncharacterized protein n=1 Tax=Actinomadura rudentiformis TaxID=359158 RepID=A0A6H9Y8I0_9ACTN|nr:hypothetical protein [Actinomadura rudentiformis]KAB2341236.1 hypothetical protein F8566_41670 [Actinomadura rudentiformis]